MLGQKNSGGRPRDDRAAWTRKEIAHLLSAPIWHGCASLDRRFSPGNEIIHDGWYWLPSMMILYGGRSAEFAGLPMSDVHEVEEIPFFQVDFSESCRLKNGQSIRKLPIHPELIRLGFIDYLAAMRAANHGLLFPEMYSEASGSFSKTFYQTVFMKWRDWAFPNGTSWRHQVGGAVKDKDVRSFRGSAATFLKGRVEDSLVEDILGHEGSSQTTRLYAGETELELKLDALKLLTPMIAHLEKKLLQLRPVDRQRFGAGGR